MGEQPVFSIVMPVYNTVKYLNVAVEAVRAQTFASWELILVDDGSTDGSEALCDAYAQKDARIRVVHQANAGASAARNAGMDAAQGTYLIFLDSDDEVEPNLLELASGVPEADIVVWGVTDEYMDADERCFKQVDHVPQTGHFVDAQAVRRALIDLESDTLLGYIWNKRYRLEQVRASGVRFENRLVTEDIFFNLRLCSAWKSMVQLPVAALRYRHHSAHTSITGRFVPDYFEQNRERVETILSLYDGWNMASDHVLTILGNIYARYIFSAVERLFDPRAKADTSARRSFLKARFDNQSDPLFARVMDHAAPSGVISRAMANALRTRNTTLCLLIGRSVRFARVNLPGLFTHLRQSR